MSELLELWLPSGAVIPIGKQARPDVESALIERIAELELAVEDIGWQKLLGGTSQEFSRSGLRQIMDLSRIMYLKNPLIGRGVRVRSFYVWGQGVSIVANNPDVNIVIQQFQDDRRNQTEFTSHQARKQKDIDLQLEGNIFFAFFVNPSTGHVRIRSIPVDEIDDIIVNPEDRKETWFYLRNYGSESMAYPDWRYNPVTKPDKYDGRIPIIWTTPVYHVKVGGLADMRFGVPEVYAALDWAVAYKQFLEDWATLTRAYSRFAQKLTTKGGAAAVARAKTQLGTTVGTVASFGVETNPAPVAGSTWIQGEGVDLQTMRIGGANISAEDGRRIMLMVAAGQGLPESFYGDVSVGNLATAKSLDRPTELMMKDAQTLWADIHRDIYDYVIDQAIVAPKGLLQGETVDGPDGEPMVQLGIDANTGQPMDRSVGVNFPSIIEPDTQGRILSIIAAATLDGKTPAGTMDDRTLVTQLAQALDLPDIDQLVAGVMGDDTTVATIERKQFVDAMRKLSDGISRLQESH